MTTNIYVIRHGEVNNPKKIVYGRLPRFGLSEKGRAEIIKTSQFLTDKNIVAIYSSPLLRARQTAQIIQMKLNLNNILLLKSLLEAKTSLEGEMLDKLDLANLDYFSTPPWKKTDDTMQDIANRMQESLKTFLKKHKGKSVVAISHGDPIMILKAIVNKLPLTIESIRPKYYLSHGEVTLLQKIDDHPLSAESVFIPKI